MTAFLGNNNSDKEWIGQFDTAMVALLLIRFAAAVCKLLFLAKSMVKL